jgi:hypothetical protein
MHRWFRWRLRPRLRQLAEILTMVQIYSSSASISHASSNGFG